MTFYIPRLLGSLKMQGKLGLIQYSDSGLGASDLWQISHRVTIYIKVLESPPLQHRNPFQLQAFGRVCMCV